MSLLAPAGLWFLLALPVILFLYLIQSRYRPQVVASLLLWKRMARDLEAEASWRRPRRDALLFLQLLLAALIALAIARPAIPGSGAQRLVVVLDSSANMDARDVQPSRFGAAQQEVANVVGRAAPGSLISLVDADTAPRVVVEDGTPADVISGANDLKVESTPPDMPSAVRLASGLAFRDGNGGQVVVVTDGAFNLNVPPQAAPVSFDLVGGSAQDLAVSEVSLRRPIDRDDYLAGFARVVNFSAQDADTSITILADSVPVQRVPLQVAASSRAEATFQVPPTAQSVSVVLPNKDTLAADARVDLSGFSRWARTVTIVSDTPTLWEHVLSVVPNLTTRSVNVQDYNPTDVPDGSIFLFDGNIPATLPLAPLVLINPPDQSTVVSRVDSLPRQRQATQIDASDPLLQGLDIAPLNIQQLHLAVTPPWAAASVGADDTPLILHGHLGDQRAVIFTFDPNKSNLPHLAAFPLLMGNVVDWLSPGRQDILLGGLGTTSDTQPKPQTDLPALGTAAPGQPAQIELWPWFVVAAGLVFLAEWSVAVRRG